MRVQVTAYVAFLSLLAAAALSPKPANATSASPVTDTDPLPVETRPPVVRLFFELQPAGSGLRDLVLRDDADLLLPLGVVQPFWACDTHVDHAVGDACGLRIECGGGAIGASVTYYGRDGTYWPEEDKVTVRSHGDHPVQYTVPMPRPVHVEFDAKLLDPQHDCDPSGPTDVDLSVKRVALGAAATHEWDPTERVVLRSSAYPIEASIEKGRHQDCIVEREVYDADLQVHCPYRDAPADPRIEVSVRDGALIWREVFAQVCSSPVTLHGGWRLGCGATVHWPPAKLHVEEEPFFADDK